MKIDIRLYCENCRAEIEPIHIETDYYDETKVKIPVCKCQLDKMQELEDKIKTLEEELEDEE